MEGENSLHSRPWRCKYNFATHRPLQGHMLATLHQDRDFTCCCQRGSFISSSGRLRQAEASVFVDCQRICGAWCRGVSPESEELCQPLSSWPPSPQVSCAVKLERRICHMNLLSIACYSAESSMLPQPSTTQRPKSGRDWP